MPTKIQLRGLKGLNSLSPSEYRKWRKDNAKYLGKYSTLDQEERLYNTQRFANKYGKDVARRLSYDQRVAIEKQDLEKYNNSIINKTVSDLYTPFREDGTVDPNKGVGDVNTFYKIMGMEPQFQKELAESTWLTGPEMNKKLKEYEKTMSKYVNPDYVPIGSDPELDLKWSDMYSYSEMGKSANEKFSKGKNQNIFDKIYGKSLAFKAKNVEPSVEAEYQKLLNIKDVPLKKEFINEINPKKGISLGIPQLAAFYDKEGNIRSNEVKQLGADEMRRWIAKKKVYEAKYGPETAYDMLDKEAKDYIDDHQSTGEYLQALANDMAIGASAYTADKINSMRAAYLSIFDKEEVPAYIDKNGHFWGKEYVKNGIYTDPYSGERIPVTLTKATPSALDAQGIAPDGTTRGLFFNNRYWSDAESTGTWTRKEQARAKELNGYSPTKAVYKVGEDTDYFWEVAKMAQFAAADVVASTVVGSVPVGGIIGTTGKVFGGISKMAKPLKALEKVSRGLTATGAAVSKAYPTVSGTVLGLSSAGGIGHAYGRGVFGETLEKNVLSVDNNLRSEEETKFHNLYNSDSKEGKRFKNIIDKEVNDLALTKYNEYRDQLNGLSDGEKAELFNSLKQEAQKVVANKYIDQSIEVLKTGDKYTEQLEKAAELATGAALTAAWTTGIKYAYVNLASYRQFLFKDPIKRIKSASSKFLKNISEGSNKRLTFKEKFANATKGVKAKEVGKIALSQAWGGAWTNFTDELQSAGARKINDDKIARYLNGDYDAIAEAESQEAFGVISGIGAVMRDALSYTKGAIGSLSESSTWKAGLVGALGSITSVVPNMANIAKLATNKRTRDEWRRLRAEGKYGEMVNMLITNGILNTYYDRVLGERQAKAAVDQINSILDNYDDFKVLNSGMALDMASIDATNPHDKDAIEYVKAAQIANFLEHFSKSESDGELLALAQRSSIFKDALETVDKITGDKFTSEDAKNYLAEYYAKNPHIVQSEDNSATAIEAIKSNAQKLKTGIEVVNKVNEAISNAEKNGKEISPLVKARLVERFALDQFLGERISNLEEAISGKNSITLNTVAESYGNEKAINTRVEELGSTLQELSSNIDTAKSEKAKADKKVEDFKESKKDEETGNPLLTTEEQKELVKLQAEADAAAMQVRALEEQKTSISAEIDKLKKLTPDSDRVLSKEEILRLSPEDRARMLNKDNIDNYSEAQQVEINSARAELALRTTELFDAKRELTNTELLDSVQDLALMVQRRRANSSAYSMMMENPEAAAAQLESESIKRTNKVRELSRQKMVEQMEDFIIKMEDTPHLDPMKTGLTSEDYETFLFNNLMNFGIGPGLNSLKHLSKAKSRIIQKYSHVFDRAIDGLQLQSDVKDAIDAQELNDTQRRGIIDSTNLMISNLSVNNSLSRQSFLDELGTVIEAEDVSASDKALYTNLLNSLEEIWGQTASTSNLTKEQRQKAVDDALSKEADDKAKIDAAEKEAEEKEEEKEKRVGEEEKEEKEEEGEEEKKTEEEKEEEKEEKGEKGKGVIEDNESTLTEEEIEKAVKEGKDGDLDSPSLKEQSSNDKSGKVNLTTVSKDDSTDQGNLLPVTSTALIGNSMFRYDLDLLKEEGKLVARKGKDANGTPDKMSRYFNWMESAGIKYQDIIDNELREIAKLDKKLYPLFVKVEKNATNDDAMADFPLLVVEYTSDVANIHNDKYGGVLTSGGKQYLVIGPLGFPKGTGSGPQGNLFRSILNKSLRKPFFDAHPSERFFVDTSKHTKIDKISAGRLVRQLETDSEVKIRKVSELLADESRNPKGLTLGDLKWYIQRGDDIVTVNVSGRNTIYPDRDSAGNKGATFLLIETANGNYIPAYIRPVGLSSINDGKLKTLINDLFKELASQNLSERRTARNKLRNYLVLREGENDINCGAEGKPKVSVIKNGAVIRTFDLSNPNVNIFGQGGLLETLNGVDFKINITAQTLSDVTSLEMFDEAGALTTDIAKLGTSNADYTVYGIDADGNPIIPAPDKNDGPTLNSNSDLSKSQKEMNSERIGNATYRRDSNGNWSDEEVDKLVTDQRLIGQLNYRNIIKTRDLKPVKVTGKDEIFIVSSDKNNPLVIVRRNNNYIFEMSKEGALKTINEINTKLSENAREERINKELEKEDSNDSILETLSEKEKRKLAEEGEYVDLGDILTKDQIEEQMNGNFESEGTVQQKTAEEQFAKIKADEADLELSGDTYVRISTGEKLPRVTSVISADTNGKRFPSDSVWTTPSTTLGTGAHNFIEDLLFNKAGDPNTYAERYPNSTNEELQHVAKEVEKLKEVIRRRGLTIAGTEVKISGTVEVFDPSFTEKRTLEVAGTIDLLLYDKDGRFIIFDFKTKRGNIISEADKTKWGLQTSLYNQVLNEKYGLATYDPEVAAFFLRDTKTRDGKYPIPKGATLEDGRDLGGTAVYTTSGENNEQLVIDGVEYKDATADYGGNVVMKPINLHIEYAKLTPTEQALVKVVNNSAPLKNKKAPVVQSEPIKTGEDINKTGTKSLAELQNDKQLDNAASILKSTKDGLGKKARDRLKKKFPDMPGNLTEAVKFLQEKGIAVTNISNVEDWLKMIEDCH